MVKKKANSSQSSSTTISTIELQNIVERLKTQRFRSSTQKTYYAVWKQFANFYLRLDYKPLVWEECITLFIVYLIENKLKSSTIKSYLSALRGVLAEDGIDIPQENFVLSSLIRASKLQNDTLTVRLPIHKDLLHLILKEINSLYSKVNQPYLKNLYMALFSTSYYGLLRIGEITASPHALKSRNVHIGMNKNKVLLVLTSSKTHTEGNNPQMIKISSTPAQGKNQSDRINYWCPFQLLKNYLAMRPQMVTSHTEQFFVFMDKSPVSPIQVRKVLKTTIGKIGLDPTIYCFHGFRSGRAGDLLRLGVSVETIKKLGRWKSNAVFTCLRN